MVGVVLCFSESGMYYDLCIMEEFWEVVYFDMVKFWIVDVFGDVEVFLMLCVFLG